MQSWRSDLLQGTSHPIPRSPEGEGRKFRCSEPNCPMRFCVLDGFIFAFDVSRPELPICEAQRGPHHTVRHRSVYHEDCCGLDADGRVPRGFRSEQCRKVEALIQKEVDGIPPLVKAFTIHLEQLLLLVANIPGLARRLKGKPELLISMPSSEVRAPRTFTLSAVRDMRKPWNEAQRIRKGALKQVRNLCQILGFLRALHQLARQKLHGKCLSSILVMLGSPASYFPKQSYISVPFEEDEEVQLKVQPTLVHVLHRRPASS